VRVHPLVASHLRGWRGAIAALLCLAPLVLTACGGTTAKPAARVTPTAPTPALTPLPRSIHAPPGFSLSICPATTGPNGSRCFTRPTSVVLTRSVFAQMVRAAGVTIAGSSRVWCDARRPIKKPRIPYLMNCRAWGLRGRTKVFAHAISLVSATAHSFSVTTRDIPQLLPGPDQSDGAPIVIEFLNFGPTTSTSNLAIRSRASSLPSPCTYRKRSSHG
jgi:hypothetical protein